VPELPDVVVYAEHLERLLKGATLRKVRLASPFVLRSVAPPPGALEGRALRGVSRLGKRLVFSFEGEEGNANQEREGDGGLFLVLHLMIAGRLKWSAALAPAPIPRKIGLLSLDFDRGSLLLREASPKKRAWIRVVGGRAALAALDPGGLEPLEATREAFVARLRSENHTLKRALTDPALFSGIGNAYSDEILHAAMLSPVALTSRLGDADAARLFEATRTTLADWTERLRREAGDAFPEKVTAFREEMAVHGKFGKPCPRCGTAVQRIVYEANETNYCPACQTGGKLLADRSLSRLLRGDWPKSLEEMEERKEAARTKGLPSDP
jgi:formamidopyrimidine-DNA glycosylase